MGAYGDDNDDLLLIEAFRENCRLQLPCSSRPRGYPTMRKLMAPCFYIGIVGLIDPAIEGAVNQRVLSGYATRSRNLGTT
ncbi:hypothetical protein V491_00995 [Pseudogymnoascus sp. VKM F-3775]|nr:hypothetical protein V491_00995 [Pseudogymnoascus sp. VKM F-3775]